MNELEKLREENKALKLLLEMKDAEIDLLNKLNEARGFSQGGYVQKEGEWAYGGTVMPCEHYFLDETQGQSSGEIKTTIITINEDGTMSKTED